MGLPALWPKLTDIGTFRMVPVPGIVGQGVMQQGAPSQVGMYVPDRGLRMGAPLGLDFSINNYWSQVFGPVNPSSVAGWYRSPKGS